LGTELGILIMNFKSGRIRLNEFYLHKLVIGKEDVNVMIKNV